MYLLLYLRHSIFSEIFTAPVRTTHCGHNFCEKCLVEVSRGEADWSCPECRQIHSCSIDSIARGYFIEKCVEKFNANTKETPKKQIGHCKMHDSDIQIRKFVKFCALNLATNNRTFYV